MRSLRSPTDSWTWPGSLQASVFCASFHLYGAGQPLCSYLVSEKLIDDAFMLHSFYYTFILNISKLDKTSPLDLEDFIVYQGKDTQTK